jgi:PST family polysaccharide transporter
MTQAVPRPSDSVLRKIAGNGGWWLAERLGMLGLTLLTSVVVVRSLGPAGYGELSYVLALVGLLAPVVQFGVSGLVARGLLERPDDEAAVLRAALVMRFAGAATALAIGLGWWLLFEPRPGDRWIVLVLLAAQMATSFQVVESWFQVHFRASALVPWRTGVIIAAALLKMAVAAATGDPRAVALMFSLEYVALGVASLIALRRAGGPRVGARESSGWLRWFAARSPWLLASGVAEVIYLRIDIVLLERLRGVEEAGTYAVAARLSEVWYMVPVALMGAVFPVLWSRRSDPDAYARSLQGSLDALFAMAFVIAVIVQFVGGPLVEILFGERFAASTPVLQIHIWAGVFIFMRALLSRWLLAEDLLRFSLVTHVAGAVMNVALNLLLIPRYGATGAALATVASYACAGWLALFLSERTRPMGRAMARSLLLPLRWGDLAAYARRIAGEWRARAEASP